MATAFIATGATGEFTPWVSTGGQRRVLRQGKFILGFLNSFGIHFRIKRSFTMIRCSVFRVYCLYMERREIDRESVCVGG